MEFIEITWQTDHYRQEMQLRNRLLRQPLGLTFTDEDLLAERNELHFGVLSADQLVACVVAVPLGSHRAKIRQMVVDDEFQARGVGSFLLQNTEATLLERGFSILELHARQTALGFYDRMGYQQVGDEFIEVNLPHFKMTKHLTAGR